jgi:hypothetical protein
MRDLGSMVKLNFSIGVAAKTTATVNGTAIDLAPYDGAAVLFHVGTWTDGTHTLTVEESDASGSGFATVAAADLIGTLANVTANGSPNTIQEVGYIGKKRYIRPVIVSAGTTTGAVLGATVLTGFPRKMPV